MCSLVRNSVLSLESILQQWVRGSLGYWYLD